MRKPSVTLTSPFGVEVVGLAVGGHGGGLRFGGFSFCSVSGFTKETHRRSVGSSPEASPPCAWELTALCFCLQGTSGPDPTTVYVDMRALRHDRYGAPAASPLGAGAACVRCGQSPEEQLPPPPARGPGRPLRRRRGRRGLRRGCLSASPECAALFLAASHPLNQRASPLN